MGLMNLLLKNVALASFVMSRISPKTHEKRGEKYALGALSAAVSRTKAYPDFLRERGVTLSANPTMEEFKRLPFTSKVDYVDRYELDELCVDGDLTRAYSVERSSGHSGDVYYWLRLPEEDELFPSYLEFAAIQWFRVHEHKTLVLITLSLGTWTAGEKYAQAMREIAATGKYQMSVMTPGSNLEEVLEIVQDVSRFYEQVVVIGYPPFVKTMLDEGVRRGIDWPKVKLKIAVGGEGYSEQWREHVARMIGVDPRVDLLSVTGGYGAADIGLSVGREYPITVMIRRLCTQDPTLAEALFPDPRGHHSTLPSLLQYNPAMYYIEAHEGEIAFTVLSGIPLIRYIIRDSGGVMPFDEMMQVVKAHGHDPEAELAKIGYGPDQIWQMPFVWIHGRSDGTVSIMGANVFPENIHAVLADADDTDIVTFKLKVETTDDIKQRLVISLEHRATELVEEEETALSAYYYQILVEGLRRINIDFRQSHDENPEAADPVVRVHAKGTGPFAHRPKIKNKYVD